MNVFPRALLLVVVFRLITVSGRPVLSDNRTLDATTIKDPADRNDLQHLQILFRHGDRAPVIDVFHDTIPVESLWPNGMGQLTNLGIQQEFSLGSWFREQYGYYVPRFYNASDIYVRSTETDRTMMSAQSFLAGLYNCTDSQCPLVPFGIAWSPVPVHTVAPKDDRVFRVTNCPRLIKFQRDLEHSEESDKFFQKYENLIVLLKKGTSLPEVTRHLIPYVADYVICLKAHNFTLPEWCTDKIYQELREVQYYLWREAVSFSKDAVRMEIGVFMKLLADTLTAATQRSAPYHESPIKRLLVYSTHDEYMDFLLIALGYSNKEMMKYAGAIIFELFGPAPPSRLESYHLKLRFKKGWSDKKADYVQILPCTKEPAEEGCRLDQVIGHLKSMWLTEDEYDEMCRLKDGSSRQSVNQMALVLTALGIFNQI
ncbi:unnamed protein product [Calicophoron daubneyi]|uniref:acid phosphatase n=1 Tax=Calicophoron daubneyi TaxID=300641 RepID=A0AAV2T051_CALDB